MINTFKTLTSAIIETVKGYKGNWNDNDPSSPNYIRNRTHYSEYVEGKIELLPMTSDLSFSPSANQFYVPIKLNLKLGNTYTVNWKGTEYTCTAFEAVMNGDDYIGLGNQAALGGENTGEPFIIGEGAKPSFYENYGVYGGIIPLDGSTETTVSIYTFGTKEVVHKIDEKYLPEFSVVGSLNDITAEDTYNILGGDNDVNAQRLTDEMVYRIIDLQNATDSTLPNRVNSLETAKSSMMNRITALEEVADELAEI